MNENLTNEVVEEVVEQAMTTQNKSGKTAGILGIGMLLGAGLIVIGKKIVAKVRNKKEIVVEQAADDAEEENSDEE